MGKGDGTHSAHQEYLFYLDQMQSELHPQMIERFRRAIDAPLRDLFKSNYRPEWLHAYGFTLTPISENPQVAENLGAAPKWSNTEMMILERIAKWFALNRPKAKEKIKTEFDMLFDSEIIKKIAFEVVVEENERYVKFLQTINPFKKHHVFRKASDLAQATAITSHLLKGEDAYLKQEIKHGHGVGA